MPERFKSHDGSEVVSVETARRNYPDQVILLKVLQRKNGLPSIGKVVGLWPDNEASESSIAEKVQSFLGPDGKPLFDIYLTFGCDRITSGPKLQTALRELQTEVQTLQRGEGGRATE